MNTLSYKTISANAATVEKKWFVVDAGKAPLGRLCSDVATVLRGKHKPSFTPHVDCGDNVIVVNADQLVLTGKKMDDKVYIRPHRLSGWSAVFYSPAGNGQGLGPRD